MNSNLEYLKSQIGNPDGDDIPNKKFYDPRVWLRKGEEAFVERLEQAFKDLNNINTLQSIFLQIYFGFMAWFKRTRKGIQTNTKDKKDTPDGLWHKTPSGKIVDNDELVKNNFVSPEDNFHMRIGSSEYFKILFDDDKYENLFDNLVASDPLKFTDTKTYPQRIKEAQKKTGLKDAIRVAYGKSKGKNFWGI